MQHVIANAKTLFLRYMEKLVINTNSAPAPIGPYNQAVKAGSMLFVSGQIALNAETGQLVKDDIIAETHQVMQNLRNILTEAGMDFSDVVKSTIFIMDMNDFSQINEVYGKYFTGYFPARETVQVAALPKGVNVEISVIAIK
ncbi:reactive intermediate/imine deaminase [Chitinophaga cymbidii]|uniref:Reactive intermediate/imine deaminase n=2 Tax=Chitinophaga cymbidii TaxID=1096750 RepID=A0A512RI26_9BACT|nr:reactive intermediate/imine deaminase [Chitinophaga cymbidii]